jgi:hypothetical protein
MDTWTAIIIGVGGSLIVVLISQSRIAERGDDRVESPDQTAVPMSVAATAEAIFLAGVMAVMVDPAIPLLLTLPAEATAVEVTVGEAATVAEAISGRRHFIKTDMAAELFPSFFRFIPV